MKKPGAQILLIFFLSFLWLNNSFVVTAKESEAVKQCFDAAFYAAAYPDVVGVYGNSEGKLLTHYLDYGRYEGRSASSEFNLMAYRSLNADLYNTFGDDLDAYPEHYRQNGQKEGRIAMCDNPPAFETYKRPLIYEMEGIAKGQTSIGKTYIEIDLADQHLYLFVDGEVVMDTGVVTGDERNGNSTPPGIFKIYHKGTDRYLTGPDYKVWVSYWLPFNGGIGLHDATWRRNFGGTIYQKNGSHGCVNMPYSKAESLFETAYVGMPVICH